MNYSKRLLLTVGVIFSASLNAADTLIKNVHIVGGAENAVDVRIANGKIAAVGSELAANEGVTLIDGSGKLLTAGLFNSHTELGIREVGAVSGTVDASSTDNRITASLKVADAVNPDSVLIPHNRSQGLTHALVVPNSSIGMFAGTAAIIQLSASDTLVKEEAAVVMNFGAAVSDLTGGSRAALMVQLREAFEDARDYRNNRASFNAGNRRDYPMSRQDLAALGSVLDGKLPLLVFVDRAEDIRQMLAFAKQQRIKLILGGVAEGWRVASDIAAAKVPVIIDPIANLPANYDSLGARLDNAKLLNDAGVTLVFTGMGWHRTHNAYLVRQSAGNAVANGLPHEVAMQAMTTNPAKVFGLGDVGKIEPGAPANLVLWSGDPLETSTAAEAVWINGQAQTLISRQTRLRDRYFSRIKK